MKIDEKVILGLDIGIGSIGWCLLREGETPLSFEILVTGSSSDQIVPSLGTRCMDVPENAKTKELLNVKRRSARGMRRVIKRRAHRMAAMRRLLAENLNAEVTNPAVFHATSERQMSPWILRSEGLHRLLTDKEFAIIILHLCKHRGFKSNSKKEARDKEGGAVLSATSSLREKMTESGALTFGEYMAGLQKQRNRSSFDGKPDYTHTPLRSLLEEETRILFDKQRSFGNTKANKYFEEQCINLAFTQRPLASTANLVGPCAFIEGEKRAPRLAPTSERFRLAQRLATLRLKSGEIWALESKEIQSILELLGEKKSISYKILRKHLGLSSSVEFEGLAQTSSKNEKDPESLDIVGKNKSCGPGSYTFFQILGTEGYHRLVNLSLEGGAYCLGRIAKILSDENDKETIKKTLATLPIKKNELESLLLGIEKGNFADFRGTMNLSLKAMNAILPEMIKARDYAKGCELAGFDHTKTRKADWKEVRNPVVLRILREVKKQTRSIMKEFNLIPGRIHIEMLRDVGKSIEERNRITKGLNDRRAEKQKSREELSKIFGVEPENIKAEELRRYELWKQQDGKCAYFLLFSKETGNKMYSGSFKDGGIPVAMLRDGNHSTEIDHILPYSRTSDNSFHNQVLCIVSANQSKGNRTPYEWIGKDNPEAWHTYSEWVKSLGAVKGLKKRNLLMENLDTEKENRFHERNLHDSSYAVRLVISLLQDELGKLGAEFIHEDGRTKRRIFARPGAVTAYLRHQWGVNTLKYDAAGQRMGDRHHALDAFVLAACTEQILQRVTKVFKANETKREKFWGKAEEKILFPEPRLIIPSFLTNKDDSKWSFRESAKILLDSFRISRAERAKTTGALHEETLHSIQKEVMDDGKKREVLYERKPITALKTIEDLDRVKDAHRCPDVIEALKNWIEKGKLKIDLPRSAKGDIIRRVRLRLGPFTSGMVVKRGDGWAQADNASMVRTDVYQKNSKFYLVPVYTWQVAKGESPRKAIVPHKPEKDWILMDETYDFLFSMSPNSYIRVEGKNGITEGYYVGTDRDGGRITLADASDRGKQERVGARNLIRFEKYRVDRMGRLHRVRKEPRP